LESILLHYYLTKLKDFSRNPESAYRQDKVRLEGSLQEWLGEINSLTVINVSVIGNNKNHNEIAELEVLYYKSPGRFPGPFPVELNSYWRAE
jgi:hypothetical protein